MRGDSKMSTKTQRSNVTTRNTRPLGSVRVGSSMETTSVPKFPQLVSSSRGDLQAVIHGNAMTVPPQKLATEALKSEDRQTHNCSHGRASKTPSPRKRSVTGSSKSDSSSVVNSVRSEELEKAKSDLKDSIVRERELKQEIIQLRKDIDELRQIIWDKDKLIKDMQDQFIRQEEKYKELYEKEQASHTETQKKLGKVTTELAESKMEINKMTLAHQKELDTVASKHEAAMAELRAESQREISIRDEKLTKLKKQMADALQGNSWERQQQLDELSKELNRVQEEADLLRMRLKASKQPNKQGTCGNCDALTTQLTQAQKLSKDKDRMIQDLTAKCRKYEKPTPRLDSNQKQSSRSKIK